MKRGMRIVALLTLAGMIGLTACQKAETNEGSQPYAGQTINIVYQNGLSYAPFYVMQDKGIIEKYLPGVKVNYTVAGAGAAVSDALVANKADIGVMGITPLLSAWNKNLANYKMFTGLINSPLSLVVMNDKYKSLKDFGTTDKIAVPAIASIQHMILAMAAQKELGNPKALDSSVVGISHPDAYNQLVNTQNSLAGHFASPPYLYQEIEKNGREIVKGFDAYGKDFSFLVTVATDSFYKDKPAMASAVFMALSESIQLINDRDDSVIDIISKKENITKENVVKYLDWEGFNFTTTPYGSMGLAKFMHDNKYIENMPKTLSDFCFPTVTSLIGKRGGTPGILETAQNR